MSEICLGPNGSEFIEIVNPTAAAVDLTHYYLSDNGNYYKLPAGIPTLTLGDFIAQFRAGSSIAAGGAITVAIGTAATFTTAYGAAPTYSFADATVIRTAVSGVPSLTDSGELVVLFQWDGTAALVKDVDLMIAGMPTSGNGLVSKSGYLQGGSMYAADANTITAQSATPPLGKSTKRIAFETNFEIQGGGGNGITGDDETSETTSVTWDTTFSNATPGAVPPPL